MKLYTVYTITDCVYCTHNNRLQCVIPEAHSQHGLQQLLDVWLDAWTHSSGKHADTCEHSGVHLDGLLPPAHDRSEREIIDSLSPPT